VRRAFAAKEARPPMHCGYRGVLRLTCAWRFLQSRSVRINLWNHGFRQD
jgi:hypothetical protein